jgi:hypothetical protein
VDAVRVEMSVESVDGRHIFIGGNANSFAPETFTTY